MIKGYRLAAILCLIALLVLTASPAAADKPAPAKPEREEMPGFQKALTTSTQEAITAPARIKARYVSPKKMSDVGDVTPGHDGENNGAGDVGTLASDPSPSGTNNVSFANCDYGDIALLHDGWVAWGYFRHAGLFDADFYTGEYSACFWSAQKDTGVLLETPDQYHHYDECGLLWVPSATADQRYQTTWYCYYQYGEPYNITSSKSDESSWYCSKLAWKAYSVKTGLDLDADGGYYVKPDDLWNSSLTYVFAYGY